jgi:3-oxoacyl-[acyl-carrier-protein] synthase-1
LVAACRAAIEGKGPTEPDIKFIVSNDNGERYSAWEGLIGRPRFYRTRRETFPMAYPAMTMGEIGAGAGALTLLIAADSFARAYAPGQVAMCEAASEAGMRAAALVSAVASR